MKRVPICRLLFLLAACLLTGGCDAPKPTPAPGPTPAATPTPAVTATVAPTPIPAASAEPAAAAEPPPKYDGQQQANYIQQAGEAFVQLRTAKSQPFLEANNALEGAGGLSSKGLSSKETVAARREMLAKTKAANDDYKQFIATQDETYRAELAKTPLTPGDVDSVARDYATRSNTAKILKLRDDEDELLKHGDEMLSVLEKGAGNWSVSDGRLKFKRPSDQNAYAAANKKYNALAVEMQKARAELNAKPSPSASPAAAAVGATPAAAPTAAVP